MYNTVIFDLDGTLLNTLDDLTDSTNFALSNHGYKERSVNEIRRFVGNGIKKLIERALPSDVSEEEFEKVFTDFKAHYQLHCNDKTGPYEGILPLLRKLKDMGIKMGIASNKDKSAVVKLNEIYFEGLIEGAAGAEENKPVKPDPYMVNSMIEELGCDKEHTLYVGDSQVDVMTAGNTGLDMVAVLWGFRDEDELKEAGAEKFIRHPLELLKYFE